MDNFALGLMGVIAVGTGTLLSQARQLSTAHLVICVALLLGLASLATVAAVMS